MSQSKAKQKALDVILAPAKSDQFYKQKLMESIARGAADGKAGRTMSTAELENHLGQKRKSKKVI